VSNEERFWEASIAEAVTSRAPPDQSAEILAKLNAPAQRKPRGRMRWLRYPVQLAAAAALVLAIGLATGVVKWPWSEQPDPPVDPQRTWAAGPDSTVAETPEGLQLESGWLLLKPGAPDVRCGESKLTDIHGLVLARAGGEPTESEFQTVQSWLQRNQVEKEMFTKTKWVAGLAMAVMVFQGSAMLDGQKVEGEAKPINSAMDLDNLPKDATYVECRGLDGVYLTFMADTKRLQGIRFLSGSDIKREHIGALAALPDLRVLDLRSGSWSDAPDYAAILKLPKLQAVGLDFVATGDVRERTEEEQEEIRRDARGQIDSFKQFAQRGIKLEFGFNSEAVGLLNMILEAFPDAQDLTLPFANDAVCEQIAGFQNLRRLTIQRVLAGEIGFIYLSRLPKLESISLTYSHDDILRPEHVHHLGKIKTLHTLEIPAISSRFVPKGILTVIGKMTQLRKLVLPQGLWAQLSRLDGAVVTPFKGLELDEITIQTHYNELSDEFDRNPNVRAWTDLRHPLDLGFFVKARTITIHVHGPRLTIGNEGQVAKQGEATFPLETQVFRLLLTNVGQINRHQVSLWPKKLEAYTNLKRIEIGPSLMYGSPPDVGAIIAMLKEEMADRPEVEIVETEDR
jgi:hypothetical protein